MEKRNKAFAARKAILLSLTAAFVAAACFCTAMVNRNDRLRAVDDAKDKARIFLDQNQALLAYFRDEVRPKVFGIQRDVSPDCFDPVLMSSFYALRRVNEVYNETSPLPYQYKICALNARNPNDEADPYEAEVIRDFNARPDLSERCGIRDIDGAPCLTLMRPGLKVKEACSLCHGTPQSAPRELVERYGADRGFGWPLRETVSAYSVRIPLAASFHEANKFSLELTLVFSATLLGLYLLLAFMGNLLVFKPLIRLGNKAAQISNSPDDHLGEEIPLPAGDELRRVTFLQRHVQSPARGKGPAGGSRGAQVGGAAGCHRGSRGGGGGAQEG